jgi:hypothetical protein
MQFPLEGTDVEFKSALLRFEAFVTGKLTENFSGCQPS